MMPITSSLSRRAALALATLLLLGSTASVASHHRRATADGGEPGQFDYYLLSLSWSPTYCLTHPEDIGQCSGKGFGFVLHGLWPQFESGGYPQNCTADRQLSQQAAALGASLYPSPKLVQHEWERHGTCSGMDPSDYFRTADRAVAVVKVPEMFQAPRTTLSMTAAQIVAQFRASNSALPEDGITVACSRGELSEVRICLNRDLTIRSCGRRVRNSCPAVPVQLRAAR